MERQKDRGQQGERQMQGREEETGRDKGREGQRHRRETEAQRGEIDKGDRDRGRDRSREQAPKNSKESTGFRKERDHIQTHLEWEGTMTAPREWMQQ